MRLFICSYTQFGQAELLVSCKASWTAAAVFGKLSKLSTNFLISWLYCSFDKYRWPQEYVNNVSSNFSESYQNLFF